MRPKSKFAESKDTVTQLVTHDMSTRTSDNAREFAAKNTRFRSERTADHACEPGVAGAEARVCAIDRRDAYFDQYIIGANGGLRHVDDADNTRRAISIADRGLHIRTVSTLHSLAQCPNARCLKIDACQQSRERQDEK